VLWGNSEDDDTNIFERAASFFGIWRRGERWRNYLWLFWP
jgi:hypothetical protein